MRSADADRPPAAPRFERPAPTPGPAPGRSVRPRDLGGAAAFTRSAVLSFRFPSEKLPHAPANAHAASNAACAASPASGRTDPPCPSRPTIRRRAYGMD